MGQLPNTNLSMLAVANEVVSTTGFKGFPPRTAMSRIGALGLVPNPYRMSSYRNYQLPPAYIYMTQNDGGIWDGCNYWDVFCGLEGASSYAGQGGQNADPYFGYIGFYWSQNGTTFNTERGVDAGTSLTFGGGYCTQYVHGRYYINIDNYMVPNYTSFCTNVYLSIIVNSSLVACCAPITYDYTLCRYTLACEPGQTYNVACNVNYGICPI